VSGGLDLAIRRWGDGERSVLLLHGITSNAAGWFRLGEDLADRGWSVTAADLRGHGDSPPGDDYALASYAADVLALEGPWDAVLGHSLGGAVAVTASHLRSGFTSGLLLQDPALLMGTGSSDQVIEWLLEPYGRPATPQAVANANPTWAPEDCRVKAEALTACTPEVVERTIADNWPWDLIGPTSGVDVPTVVLGSDPAAGGIVPVALGEWFAAEVASVSYRMLPGAGHSAHREPAVYGVYLEAVLTALGEIGGL
jgi:pimeloyl-ACP methyl ester carboxylesterase